MRLATAGRELNLPQGEINFLKERFNDRSEERDNPVVSCSFIKAPSYSRLSLTRVERRKYLFEYRTSEIISLERVLIQASAYGRESKETEKNWTLCDARLSSKPLFLLVVAKL